MTSVLVEEAALKFLASASTKTFAPSSTAVPGFFTTFAANFLLVLAVSPIFQMDCLLPQLQY